MPIETVCTGCGRTLRVDDEHAGKKARCPACNSVCEVPAAVDGAVGEPSDAGATSAAVESHWFMKTPEGQTFGPVSATELDRWVAEGRVTAECELREKDAVDWTTADQRYPDLRPAATVGGTSTDARGPNPSPYPGRPAASASAPLTGAASGASPWSPPSVATRPAHLTPHRGGAILVLAIIGWLFCPIFGVMAWVMGTSDLREMRSGRMDPSGQGLTQAGQVLGMIQSLIFILSAVLVMFVLLFAAAAGTLN